MKLTPVDPGPAVVVCNTCRFTKDERSAHVQRVLA